MNDLREEINKRFTLNWLIQGAAQHAGMTAHHIVRDDLDAIDPGLVPLYDEYAIINLLQYWSSGASLLLGSPERFWEQASSDSSHLFFGHPILSRHGGMLASVSRQRGQDRCVEKGFSGLRSIFPFRSLVVSGSLRQLEGRHKRALIKLSKKAVTMVWGIPSDRLDGDLTAEVAFGTVTPPRTQAGRIFSAGVVGYGGVLHRSDGLTVVGRGTNWQLLTKELVKGTAELICLHGLNRLNDETYTQVVAAADGVDFEPWMLQTGGELWRRFLAALPPGRPVAEMLMHVARLPAGSLETLVLAVIEQPDWAKELLAGLEDQSG